MTSCPLSPVPCDDAPCGGRFLCQSYYRNSVGVVVAFSLLSRPSWDMVDTWVQEAR